MAYFWFFLGIVTVSMGLRHIKRTTPNPVHATNSACHAPTKQEPAPGDCGCGCGDKAGA